MQRLDRLVLKEIIGPWMFGVAMFTVLIWASSFLFRVTEYLASGVPFLTVAKLTILFLPAIIAKTFSMAMLLATLLGFGRLSGDSEIVALRAAGASLGRIMLPVGVFGMAVAILTFWFNEQVVPAAASQGESLNSEISKAAKRAIFNATAIAVQEDGKVVLIAATEFRPGSRLLVNAQVTYFDEEMNPTATLYAKELKYRNEKEWRIRGGGRLVSTDGSTVLQTSDDIWPPDTPQLTVKPDDIIAAGLKNLDVFSMAETKSKIEVLKKSPNPDEKQIANLEYGYYNKISVPLAALVFGLVGAPLGIRNARTGTATGFWLSVLIIFAYMMLANFMAVWAQGGAIPAYLASFTPLAIGLVFAAVTIHRKN